MANILFISGSYFPYATANAVCAKKYEDALKERGHSVIYCNKKHDLYELDHYIYEGTEIFTVGKNSDLFYQTICDLKKLDLPCTMKSDFERAFFIFRIISKIHRVGKSKETVRDAAREQYLDSYSKQIVRIFQERSIDLVMSISMPFDSHIAVLKAIEHLENMKTEHIPKWIAYNIDAYWSKAGVTSSDVSKMKADEAKVFSECDQILLLETIEKDYRGKEFDVVRRKMKSLPLPLFDLQNMQTYCTGITIQKDITEIVFTGTIYDDYSNMDLFVKVFNRLKGEKIRFHFIGKIYPKSQSLLEELQNRAPEQLKIYGRMPYDYAKGSMQRADILLNLANDNANQIPSKIFEYMMCQKPILNLYGVEKDTGTAYLKKYPLSYNIFKGDFAISDGLIEWVNHVKKKTVTLEEIENIYHEDLSSVICSKFCKNVEDLLNDN